MEECCRECRFFKIHPTNEDKGRCRRHPPTIQPYVGYGQFTTSQPTVHKDDWCGEYVVKEKGN